LPKLVGVHIWLILPDVIYDRRQTALVAARIIVLVLIEDKILTVLLDGVVSQMHVKVVEVPSLWADIFFGCKSRETFLVYKHPQRVDSID
jgi:hypothetical protein